MRRLLICVPILLIGTFLAFLLVACAGSPLATLQSRPGITAAQIHEATISLGLDKPLLVRYWDWLTHFVQGDWGVSIAIGEAKAPVFPTVMSALWVTIRLVVGAEVLALILGVIVGVFVALRQYSFFDHLMTALAFLLFSMPLFCVALVLKNYAIQFNDVLESWGLPRWITTAGPPDDGFTGSLIDVISSYIGTYLLPTIALMLASFPAYSRFQRSTMAEALRSGHVLTARAKGLSEHRVIFRHALRTALIPVSTVFSLNIGSVISGAVVAERVFGWNGMGALLVRSVSDYDPNTLLGWLVVTAVIIMVCNLLADVLYSVLDPRIRLD